jgi:acetylornithine deacetylase/succinyl-diaminopimelate desuccinylase-like protein
MLRKFVVLGILLLPATPGVAVGGQTRGTRPAQSQTAHPAPAITAAPASAGLDQVAAEATVWLEDLIRINTTNPPGNELAAAKYLAGILEKEGIPHEVLESTPGRGILIARLSASAVPNPTRALLIMGHLDVVDVAKDKWSVDPFAAVVKDGYLYGRGAIDDKGMTVANVAVMVALKRSGARLNRDVILLAEGDEEQGGDVGMQFAVDKNWDKIAAGYALNEGGRVMLKDGKVQWVGVQASEKVPVNVDVVATGTSGHASVPLKDNPVVHLSAAIAKIGAYEAPVQLNSVTRAYFEHLAQVEDPETAKWMSVLDTPERHEHAARILSDASPVWNSTLRDSISPTMLQAGVRANVIPPEARATLNIRLLPGNLLSPLLAILEKTVNDPLVHFEPEPSIGQAAPSSSVDGDFYHLIERTAQQEFPGAAVLPMMSTGGTDSALLRLRSVQAYGLLPFPLVEQDLNRMHGNDERIPLESFHKGIGFLYHIVSNFAVSN